MGWVLGLGNGVVFRTGSSMAWSSYWTTQTNFYGRGRSGLTIPDDWGNDANILLPYLKLSNGNEYLVAKDMNTLDISSNDFTFAMWVKSETTDAPVVAYVFGGKLGTDFLRNNGYGFYAEGDKKFECYARVNNTYHVQKSNVLFSDLAWHFLLMEVDQDASKIYFYVDNVLVGAGESYTGAWGANNDPVVFNAKTQGAGYDSYAKASYSDAYVYKKLLSAEEKTTLFNRGAVTGAFSHWLMNDLVPIDNGTGGLTLNISANITNSSFGYDEDQNQYGLDYGYTLYQKVGAMDSYIPNKTDGTERDPIAMPAGYTKSITISGSLTKHNFANSVIEFSGSQWDRSNATIYNAVARTGYYDASNPKWWHISELNEFILRIYFNTGYESACFTKITNDNTFDTALDEVFSFASNLTEVQLATILEHTNKVPTITTVTEFENARWERHPSKGILTNYNPIIRRGTQVWKTDSVYYPNVMIDPADATQLINIYGGPEQYYVTHNIGRATAPLTNMFKWTDYISNPILTMGAIGQWDEGIIMPACLLWNADDSKLWLYYAAYDDDRSETSLGLATSSDGITWTKHAGNPILIPSGSETHVGDNTQILREGDNWYMIYNYREGADILPGIRWATSSDGITWTKGSGELLTRNATYAKTYIEGMTWFKLGNKYCIFYGAYNADTDIWTGNLAYSDSPTSGYVNSASNPMFGKSPSGWDSSYTATIVPFLINGKWIFQYQSTNDTSDYTNANYHMGAGQLFKKIT